MARSSKNLGRLIDMSLNRVSVEESFLAELKKSIEMDNDKSRRMPSQTYKPSSMNCIRAMYYQVAGVQPDPSDVGYCLVGIANSGTDIHERVQKYVSGMKDNGFDCEYIDVADYVRSRNLDNIEVVSKSGMETKLYEKNLNMSFLCDGIIRYNKHYYILELKTEASFKWNNRTGVDVKHYKQGTAYSTVLDIPEVLFVYINRDVLDMKSYMFIPTQEMKSDLVDMIATCDGYVERKICPPKPEDTPKNVCAYCNYKSTCKGDK